MDITLSPATQKLLEDRMKKGGYSNPDDVVRDALEVLENMESARGELDERTLAAIEEGEAQLDRGEGTPWEELRAELEAKYLRK